MTERTVVVTGASAGVGRAVARRFAADGARIGLIARGRDGLEGAAEEVRTAGGEALVLPLDVADAEAVERATQRVEDELGPIDVWVNDAMVTVLAPVHELSAEDVRRVTEVTYLGAVNGTLAALARMRPRDHGTIVQVGSALAYRAIPLQAAYCGAKHALRGFTDALRCELLHDGSRVHVTSVHLPALDTPQFSWCKTTLSNHPQPVPPIFEPEVAAEGVHFAAGRRRREVWVGGPTVWTILGNRLAPWFADRYLARNGYRSQQTDQPILPDRPDNLHRPLPGDHGARGIFSACAHDRSLQLRLTKRRGWLLGGIALAGGMLAAGLLGQSLRRSSD
ncbi:MAG TPA: SDR family oxidoreductase [Thermoanaerobaculia bacterium]|nr:SDR family oxidoreductase [Thermoanaerobaculia bacterium]